MRFTIIKSDGLVGVDGRFIAMDLSLLPANLRVVQWLGDNGWEEWTDGVNTDFGTVRPAYSALISAWSEAAARLDSPEAFMTDEEKRLAAFQAKLAAIISMRQQKNADNFTFLGNTYISDENNIQGVRLRIDGMGDIEPIPTFTGTPIAGTWKTAEDLFIPFTVASFKEFANAYYDRREKNFTNYAMLTIQTTQMYDNGADIDDIASIDITQGWC